MLMMMLIKMVYKLQQFHNYSLKYHDDDLGGNDDGDVYDADFGTILHAHLVKRQSLIALSEVLTIALLFPIAILPCYF